ncbi:MAG TPA: replicative DNA helicase [Thermoleophilaceae bacterium]
MAISVPPSSPEAAGKLPPQNLEAETSVLGAILLAEQALDGVLIDTRLRAEDFYRPRHQKIFSAMRRLKEKPDPEAVDAVTVCDELARAGELEEAGGTAYIHSLPSMVPAAGNVRHYARIVKQHALLRKLLDAARTTEDDVYSHSGNVQELIDRVEGRFYNVAHEERTGELRSIEEVLHDELDKLELVSRQGIALTGTPSGFKDLDDLTGGFQPGNLIVLAARPSMGKCLVGSTLIFDPTTGARRPISEVVERGEQGEEIWVSALGPDLKLRPTRATAFIRSGVQQVYRVTTRLGRKVEASANHPLLTLEGWREVQELGAGTRIGVPRGLRHHGPAAQMRDAEIVLLAALIADGNLTNKTPRFCYGPNSPVLSEVERAVDALGLRVRHDGYGNASISAGRGAPRNEVTELCRRHGIWGKRSESKFVPNAIFSLSDDQVARFLSVLFGCDGYVHQSERISHIGYTTISERLAADVQHLLLRLGVVSCIRTLKRQVYEGTDKVAREVRITDQASLATFCERVGACGKDRAIERMRRRLQSVRARSYGDSFPMEEWDQVLIAKGERSWSEVSVATGRPRNHNWHVKRRALSRHLLGELAAAIDDEALSELATSDLWWDEIASIEPLGQEETYDLTVPVHHNFVANDLVVHNSALVTNIAENAAIDHDRPVALFSLEMSETELAQRFIASQAKLNGDDLRKGRVKPDRWPKVVKATEKLARSPLYVDDSSDIGILEVRAKARRLHARRELGLLVVDYLQLMRPEDPSHSRVEQIGQISRGLKILARELNIPVIAVSQLSRAVESRPDKRPLLSDLRESGQIEQDADLVMFIYRDEYYNRDSERPGEADVIIAKHRNGPVADVVLTFLSRYPKFANLYRDQSMDPAAAMMGGGEA